MAAALDQYGLCMCIVLATKRLWQNVFIKAGDTQVVLAVDTVTMCQSSVTTVSVSVHSVFTAVMSYQLCIEHVVNTTHS